MRAATLEDLPGFLIYEDGKIRRPNGNLVKQDSYAAQVGYKVFKGPNRKNYYVHVVVCRAFKGDNPEGLQVRHLDGNHLNNSASNLAWGTRLENAQDMVGHGRSTSGEKNPRARITYAQVTEIRTRRALGQSGTSLAQEYNVSPATISLIVHNKNWSM